MQVIERDTRRKSEQKLLAAARELRGVRDVRYVHPLAEIQYQAGGRHHAGLRGLERPSTIGGSSARQRDTSKNQGLYAESSSSYFPRINESHITREFREHRAKYNSSLMLPLSARRPSSRTDGPSASSGRQTARGRIEAETGGRTKDTRRKERNPSEYRTVSSVAMSLDKQGMEIIFNAFEELETLDEEEFVTEMLQALAADTASEDQRVDVTSQVSDLFRQADLSARGYLTWQDFSNFFSQTSDVVSALEDTVINKYQGDNTPPPVNFVAEIEGLIYLPDIDQVVIHDTRGKGFQSYDVPTCRVRGTASSERGAGGRIVDAVYSCHGRYIITASTSPVISFYDADQLQVRQQIPTESLQTALAIDYSALCSKQVVYSACAEGKVHVWDLESLKRHHTFFEKKGANMTSAESMMITDLEVLPATSLLACGSMDGKIYMLDIAAGRVAKTLSGHTKGVSLLRYCAENKYLVSGGIDHKLQVWNPHLEQKVGSLPGHRSQLIGLHVRPNSPEVITADESGVMKIWDLRKFAAVQTIVKELYVKNHSAATSRAMTAMCFIESQQRIAIAHSTVFFLDPARPNERASTASHVEATKKHFVVAVNPRPERPEEDDATEEEEDNKPLEVLFHPPTQCFVAITPWHVVCWEASTGSRIRSTQITLGSEVTCVAVMDDMYSCFVGCDDGSIARLVLPNAAVVIHKPVHKCGEVTAIRISMPQRRILSSGSDGNIIVSAWDTLEPIHLLNHWRGVNSVHAIYGFNFVDTNHQLGECYSVPLHLRPFFIGNEIERLKAAFAEADPPGSGTIALSMLPRVLERAFPTTSNENPTGNITPQCDEKSLTFAMFVEVVQESLTKGILANNAPALASIASFDSHAKLETLLTVSSSDSSFCVWNLKNGAVVGEVSTEATHAQSSADSKGPGPPTRRSVSMVAFLYPLPYFICVDENSSQFSVWCSIAVPPLLPKPYQCVLAYTLTNAVDLRTRASTIDLRLRSTFLTETKAGATTSPATKDELVIRAIRWFVNDRDDKKLLCVGDDRGQIHILDFKAVFRRIEDLKKQAKKNELHGAGETHEDRGRGSFSAAQTPTSPTRELLSSALLQRLQRWSAHRQHLGIRSLRVLDIENLIQPNANKRAVVISVSDNGAVQLWSLDGQRLGRLRVTGAAESLSARHWRLRVDEDEVKQKNQESAMSMLKQVEQRLSFSMNQQEEEETSTTAKEIPMKNPLLRRPTTESGAGQLRSSPRSLRIAKEPLARRAAMTTEDALVAWRRSVQANQSRPLLGRPSTREPIQEDERG